MIYLFAQLETSTVSVVNDWGPAVLQTSAVAFITWLVHHWVTKTFPDMAAATERAVENGQKALVAARAEYREELALDRAARHAAIDKYQKSLTEILDHCEQDTATLRDFMASHYPTKPV